jgi:hypothetical protein
MKRPAMALAVAFALSSASAFAHTVRHGSNVTAHPKAKDRCSVATLPVISSVCRICIGSVQFPRYYRAACWATWGIFSIEGGLHEGSSQIFGGCRDTA